MGENLDSAVNSLSEQTKKINIALFYTGNDMDKAKQMVAGSFKDVIALKMKFTSSSLYGAMIFFINSIQFRFIDSFLVVSNDYLIANIDNMQDWKTFEKDIAAARANLVDFRLITEIKDKLDRGFSSAVLTAVAKLIEKNDTIQLSNTIKKFVQESAGLQRVDISMEYQKISSLEMEVDSVSTRKIDSKVVSGESKEAVVEPFTKNAEDSDEVKEGSNGIRAIIRSSLILSPVKGKHISELKMGDRVLISMVETNDQSRAIAKAFKAYDEEEKKILPVPARVKSIKFIEGTGFKIYVVIAKGIVGQIVEEEKNIKVAMDPAAMFESEESVSAKGATPGIGMIIVLVAIILSLVFFIVFMVV
jgi:hypothetical protein